MVNNKKKNEFTLLGSSKVMYKILLSEMIDFSIIFHSDRLLRSPGVS